MELSRNFRGTFAERCYGKVPFRGTYAELLWNFIVGKFPFVELKFRFVELKFRFVELKFHVVELLFRLGGIVVANSLQTPAKVPPRVVITLL